MTAIQRFTNELTSQDRRLIGAIQLGLTSLLTVVSVAVRRFKEPAISPQFAFAGGLVALTVSHLTDSAIKAYYDTRNHPERKTSTFHVLKSAAIGAAIAGALCLTEHALLSRNISIGLENAFSAMSVVSIIPTNYL